VGVALEVFGHRGACGYLPENTMESFELAFELGCSAIEFDVVLTKDLVPVIRHDRDFL
jgi:glycerophosphoryl diester phosphodiesterase